MALGLIVPLLN